MDKTVKVKTIYTKDALISYNFFNMTHDRLHKFIVVMCLFLSLFNVYTYISNDKIIYGFFAIGFLALILISRAIYRVYIKNRINKLNDNIVEYNYTFYKKYFEIKEENNKKINYSDVEFKSDDKYIYIYVKKDCAFIVEKGAELCEFLKQILSKNRG